MASKNFDIPTSLEVHPVGDNGEMIVLPAFDRNMLSTTQLPCGLPPILPDTNSLLQSFLENIEKLPMLHVDAVQRFVPCEPNISSLYNLELSPLQTELAVKRNMTTGKLLGFSEEVKDFSGGTTKTSTSLSRAPGLPEYGIKGSTSSFPFWPGGMEEPWIDLLVRESMDTSLFDGELLDTPPGFKNGMQFERKVRSKDDLMSLQPNKISLADVLAMDDFLDLESLNETDLSEENNVNLEKAQPVSTSESAEASNVDSDMIKIKNLPVLNISETTSLSKLAQTKYQWAVVEDVSQPVEGFHEKIPHMAFQWKFELDTFQKKAVLHLEKHESVFVAAHTSAGKTVVAEYAIALAKKHMTRVIYTSPIKALSNQKYREFKIQFEDVGLITGDVVINPTAFCLIMTTEILRSMLYNGSDVVREVEWVVFDEVHYINDAERGVVWEEVFIMLPRHVNLIMLSATVPNTAEFAEWLGGIKKRKIYVISTLKRPVPLVHYLYTGSVGKSQDDLFAIVDATGKFSDVGYQAALNARKNKENKSKGPSGSKGFSGPKGMRYGAHLGQEKNIYIGLLGYLQKKKLLPVVCFTLSKKKCKAHAEMLQSQDFTTLEEKNDISHFFKRSISKLKDDDKKLAQVKIMGEQLKRGFGVHHSGILPILKEVVEMLFQKGLVKVLFATETFAMGVNMPAKTVVFDSIRKHDGKEMRDLQPSEYIQMAGRAGRRGLDDTGTVIILCQGDIPDVVSLHSMMLGKPTKLTSQFKLTYSMILNLLKIKTLRVEDVMKRSFGELDNQKYREKCQTLLGDATDKRSKISKPECSLCATDLEQYWKSLENVQCLKKNVMQKICHQAVAQKVLIPGRIVAISTSHHQNVAGVILNIDKSNKCKILVISEKDDGSTVQDIKKTNPDPKQTNSDSLEVKPWTKCIFFPNERKPEVLLVAFQDIQTICNKTLRIDEDLILKDWRKIETMKCNPGACISAALQELSSVCEAHRTGFPKFNCNFKDPTLMDNYLQLQKLEDSLFNFTCIQCPEFSQHFALLSNILKLEDDILHYKHQISEQSLKFHHEFQQRKQVLQHLGYIDAEENILLKGSVAREMSNHELLVTELIMKCVLGTCPPEEIAAMLSCMVFQQKSRTKLEVTPSLQKKIVEINEVISNIEYVQKVYRLDERDFADQYNFHLVNIVYQWAKGISFAEIMENTETDIEEGVIVRSIQRLSELLKDVRDGAKLVGEPVLAKKMEDASRMIKRDIVFAASLYTQ